MGKTAWDIYKYSDTAVVVLGILGNTLVSFSILGQKKLLKNNYYFVVLHLAICDLAVLIFYLIYNVNFYLVEEQLFTYSTKYCAFYYFNHIFRVAGIGMMLIISLLRYRATVHPLKPDISRRKLKVVCGLVYVVGVIAGYGSALPRCFLQSNDAVTIVYYKVWLGYVISCFYFFPTLFTAVVYYKIGRALTRQKKLMKNLCSNLRRGNAPGSPLNILKYIKNRQTFFVCLLTVVCFGVGIIPMTVYVILKNFLEYQFPMKYIWILHLANVLRVASSHSVNPLIYGTLDKKLLTFCKRNLSRKRKQKSPENRLNTTVV